MPPPRAKHAQVSIGPQVRPLRSRMRLNRPRRRSRTRHRPLVGQVQDKAVAAANEQKQGLADQIEGLAQSVHKSGEQFAGQQDWIAGAIDRGANELSSLANALRENDLGSLYGQVRSLARQQPALFIGACLAGGFALARVGKPRCG